MQRTWREKGKDTPSLPSQEMKGRTPLPITIPPTKINAIEARKTSEATMRTGLNICREKTATVGHCFRLDRLLEGVPVLIVA